MTDSVCYLVGAGSHYTNDYIRPDDNDYVIAVDGGYDVLNEMNITPDLLVGDFDSVTDSNLHSKCRCEILDFPPEKDFTDMYLAAMEGIKRGYRIFYIYGGTGKRVDHTLANYNLLAWISTQNAAAYLYDEKNIITAITNTAYSLSTTSTDKYHANLKAGDKGYITILSHSDRAVDVNLRGLKYPTNDVVMTNTTVLGTSNEFTGTDCTISVKEGTLLIVLER